MSGTRYRLLGIDEVELNPGEVHKVKVGRISFDKENNLQVDLHRVAEEVPSAEESLRRHLEDPTTDMVAAQFYKALATTGLMQADATRDQTERIEAAIKSLEISVTRKLESVDDALRNTIGGSPRRVGTEYT